MASDYARYLRDQLGSGQHLDECHRCWKKESAGVTSARQMMNENLGIDPTPPAWMQSFFQSDRDWHVVMADIKTSNVCNFSCVMCDPIDSSRIHERWSREQEKSQIQSRAGENLRWFNVIMDSQSQRDCYRFLDQVIKQGARRLKILGGEPLLDKKLRSVLANVPDPSKIDLHFTTNGSQDLVACHHEFSKFKTVTFSVSLEGIGTVQDWARQGSDWTQIEKNILAAREHQVHVVINHSFQAATILRLHELLRWADQHALLVLFGSVDWPEWLSLGVLPESLRDQAKRSLESWPEVHRYVDQTQSRPDLQKKFLDYVEWYESAGNLKLRDIVPEIYQSLT